MIGGAGSKWSEGERGWGVRRVSCGLREGAEWLERCTNIWRALEVHQSSADRSEGHRAVGEDETKLSEGRQTVKGRWVIRIALNVQKDAESSERERERERESAVCPGRRMFIGALSNCR